MHSYTAHLWWKSILSPNTHLIVLLYIEIDQKHFKLRTVKFIHFFKYMYFLLLLILYLRETCYKNTEYLLVHLVEKLCLIKIQKLFLFILNAPCKNRTCILGYIRYKILYDRIVGWLDINTFWKCGCKVLLKRDIH